MGECGATTALQNVMANDPILADRIRKNEEYLSNLPSVSGMARQPTPPTYYVPVVVHILEWYTNATTNPASASISRAQVQAQLDELNQDFAALNADLSQLSGNYYEPRIGSPLIQFCLATRNAQGDTTTGIERIMPPNIISSYNLNDFSSRLSNPRRALPAFPKWPSDKYLNIWVCPVDGIVEASGFIGIATFPGSYSVATGNDGIAIHTAAFGTDASGRTLMMRNYRKGRTLTHEVGHWLGLHHIWGDDDLGICSSLTGAPNVDDDGIADTPAQENSTGSYFGNTCPGPTNYHYSCGHRNNDYDMYMNFMDYTYEQCYYMFTKGQVAWMRATLDPATPINRVSVLSSLGAVPTQLALGSNLTGTDLCEGNQRNYEFRAELTGGCGGPPPMYTWTVPTGWVINHPGAFLPGIIPDGIHGGTISVTVSYTDGVNTVTLPTASITLQVVPNTYPTPTFTSGNDMCAGQTQSLTVAAAANALSYYWYVPAGFSVSGVVLPTADFVMTSGPTLALLAPATLASGSYTVTCQAVYDPNINKNSGCPASPAATLSFNVFGQPTATITDMDPQQRYNNDLVCASRRISLSLSNGSTLSNIVWNSAQASLQTNQGLSTAEFITPGFNASANNAFDITATFQSANGCTGTATYHATVVSSNTTLPNGYDCNTAPQRPALRQPFPNPADDKITLSGFQGSCALYNNYGELVERYQVSETGSLVSTQRLPNGLYVLTGMDAEGKTQRYTIQIQH